MTAHLPPIRELGEYPPWPDPATCPIVGTGKKRLYRTPEGLFPGPTTVNKVLGLGTEGLIRWGANLERQACLQAAAEVYAEGTHGDGPAEFAAAVEHRLGPAREHAKALAKAGEIGNEVHQAARLALLGQTPGPLSDAATLAFMAFDDWWKASGLTLVRSEQPVWDAELGYAGTIDAIVSHPEKGLGIVDLKSSKHVYDEHHIQLSAYMHAGRRWADLQWAQIIHLPKSIEDVRFEVVPYGKLYDRTLTHEQLFGVFCSAFNIWKALVA